MRWYGICGVSGMNIFIDQAQREDLSLKKCGSGQLPVKRRGETWAGQGCGAQCSLCDRPIDFGQVEYEWRANARDGRESLLFHLMCFQSWSFVSMRLRRGVFRIVLRTHNSTGVNLRH